MNWEKSGLLASNLFRCYAYFMAFHVFQVFHLCGQSLNFSCDLSFSDMVCVYGFLTIKETA